MALGGPVHDGDCGRVSLIRSICESSMSVDKAHSGWHSGTLVHVRYKRFGLVTVSMPAVPAVRGVRAGVLCQHRRSRGQGSTVYLYGNGYTV